MLFGIVFLTGQTSLKCLLHSGKSNKKRFKESNKAAPNLHTLFLSQIYLCWVSNNKRSFKAPIKNLLQPSLILKIALWTVDKHFYHDISDVKHLAIHLHLLICSSIPSNIACKESPYFCKKSSKKVKKLKMLFMYQSRARIRVE